MPDAVVLAGGEDKGPLREITGVAHRPLIELAERSLLNRTLAAMRAARRIERIALVGGEEVTRAADRALFDVAAPACEEFADNILQGVEALGSQGQVLFSPADFPFLTPEALDDFIARAQDAQAALAYPIIRREDSEAKFPGTSRTYVRLRQGTFTGGNIVLAEVEVLRRCRDLVAQIFGHRKNPVRLAQVFGFGFVLRLALGKLDVAQLEQRAAQLLGARVAAVMSGYPEIGFDVDKPADLEDARRLVARVESAA
jgi:GTP:adenosylcobinamide-phosphate guanylyltransferase